MFLVKFEILIGLLLISVLNSTSTPDIVTSLEDDSLILKPKSSTNKNIIFMIGDGMGSEEIKLASLIEYGIINGSIFEEFPSQAWYSTDDIHGKITDSAASGTALATGQLTANSMVGIDTKSVPIKTILEYLKDDFNYSTGIVTTTEIAHATPATFAAHAKHRDLKTKIRDQLLSQNIDVVLGGGLGGTYIGGRSGAQNLANNHNYTLVTNTSELNQISNSTDSLLGLFGYYNIDYELERNPQESPSLQEMTSKALQLLDSKNKPFFVMIEGGRIDHAGHLLNSFQNKTIYNALETINFEKSVRVAYEYAKAHPNTILITTADHETGGLKVHDFSNLDKTLPDDKNSRNKNNEIRYNRSLQIDTSWLTTSHTGQKVRFSGYGFDFNTSKIQKNTDVFWALNEALGNFPVIRTDYPKSGQIGKLSFRVVGSQLEPINYNYRSTEVQSGKVVIGNWTESTKNTTITLTFESSENTSIVVQILVKDVETSIKTSSLKFHLAIYKGQAPISSTNNVSYLNSMNLVLVLIFISLKLRKIRGTS